MSTDTQITPGSKKMYWAGWILSILPALALFPSATMKFLQPASMTENLEHIGWPVSVMLALGIVELLSTVLYLIPQTAVLGAILLTGYLGGAIATHVRIGESFIPPLVIGVIVWLGLFLRDPRIRALIPLRT